MKFKSCYIIQYIAFFILATVFIVGSLYFKNYLQRINHDKSSVPVLIYTNTLSEANDVLEFIITRPLYLSHIINCSDEIESSLIEKYDLGDFRTIAGDFRLPYQLELFLKPTNIRLMVDFVDEISAFFPTYLINYNERFWLDIDKHYRSLYRKVNFMEILYLVAMAFVLIYIRSWYIMKHRNAIDAILLSGVKKKILVFEELKNNSIFLGIAMVSALGIYIIVNSFAIVSYLTDSFFGREEFINWYFMILMLIVVVFSLILQKPLLIRKRKDIL